MKDRIVKFLAAEKITPAEFADRINVQRSSMSHILNGRNHPSASFLQKMLQAYPDLNPRWLMIGDGTMYTVYAANTPAAAEREDRSDEPVSDVQSVLFQDQEEENPVSSVAEVKNIQLVDGSKEYKPESNGQFPSESTLNQNSQSSGGSGEHANASSQPNHASSLTPEPSYEKEIEQVLFFYKDKTFRIYRPS